MLKNKIVETYKTNLFHRFDGDKYTFYFSEKDFKGLNAKPYEFKKGDLTLRGKFYYYGENINNKHIVIFEHGMGAGHTSYLREIELLAKNNFLVYSYDRTGCMSSDGEFATGFLTSISDLDHCLKALKHDFPDCVFSVIGHSWGGFSTLNVAGFHPDVKHVISMSGFINPKFMLQTLMGPFLGFAVKEALKLESTYNPGYIHTSAIEALKNYQGHALIIHSKDDKVVSYKNLKVLYKHLSKKDNISFIIEEGKNHNPNYTKEGLVELNRFVQARQALAKTPNSVNKSPEEFINQFDWMLMTNQDMNVWNKILECLKK